VCNRSIDIPVRVQTEFRERVPKVRKFGNKSINSSFLVLFLVLQIPKVQLNRLPLLFVQSFVTFSIFKTQKAESIEAQRQDATDNTAKSATMTKQLDEMLQHADQLFDENHHQDAIDLLKKWPVS
jgi:hypothetical protein